MITISNYKTFNICYNPDMPELPEVETIRRGLERMIVGKTIVGVEVRLAKMFMGQAHLIIDTQVESVRRFGKGLVIDLSNGYSLTAHVKMTGQFVYQEVSEVAEGVTKGFHPKLPLPFELPDKHTHVIFTLQDEDYSSSEQRESRSSQRASLVRTIKPTAYLFYNDIRQFGWLKVVKTSEVKDQPFFKSLGPEPLADLTQGMFIQILAGSPMPIKPLLMDQTKLSGVGNIYANDALYASAIDPRRKANSLTRDEIERLFTALLEVLEKGIALGGASETNYIQVDGGKGSYQDHFLVYGKVGETCSRCGLAIERIVQSGRSTFYCPGCQE